MACHSHITTYHYMLVEYYYLNSSLIFCSSLVCFNSQTGNWTTKTTHVFENIVLTCLALKGRVSIEVTLFRLTIFVIAFSRTHTKSLNNFQLTPFKTLALIVTTFSLQRFLDAVQLVSAVVQKRRKSTFFGASSYCGKHLHICKLHYSMQII